jgi:hypothetical protein
MTFILHAAYGRTYETPDAATLDWLAGKDFRIGATGPYCSIRDSEHIHRMRDVYLKYAHGLVLIEPQTA